MQKPTPTTRPANFDQMLVDYLPALRQRVRKLSSIGREEIVSDAIELALRSAHTFNPERGGFYVWLMFHARTAARDYRVRTQRRWDTETQERDSDLMGHTPAPQIDAVMLREVLVAANDNKGRAAVMVGMGYTAKELGKIEGKNPVYANECARKGRASLREFAGLAPLRRAANDNGRPC